MCEKEFIVRNIDISYFNDSNDYMNNQELGDYLTDEYGKAGFVISSMIPVFDENKVLIAYKVFFVRNVTN